MDFQLADLVTVSLLVLLEGLLSADNALVMAVMILGLPRPEQKKALRYGLVGAFAFRIIATALAAYLIQISWVKLLGGLYLLYLAQHHFFASGSGEERNTPKAARPWLGLSALWATVVKVELVNLAFSVDSILVAVAMSP
jgi:YkoY family integral membrane protein